MAIGTINDAVIYNEQFRTLMGERLKQVTDNIINASNGAIQMVTRPSRGDYEQENFFKLVNNMITRRDDGSTAAANFDNLSQGENNRVKVKRKVRVGSTEDFVHSNGHQRDAIVAEIAEQYAVEKVAEMLNTAVTCAVAAIGANPAVTHNAGAVISPREINATLRRFGDRYSDIGVLLAHSGSYFDLNDNLIGERTVSYTHLTLPTTPYV